MKLTQPEIIQMLRRRMGMNQGTFGSKAFNTSFESGRTKIKNIELGKQRPTQKDLNNMATLLNIPVQELDPVQQSPKGGQKSEGILITPKTLKLFPGLDSYLEMLNKAIYLNDRELVDHLSEKISSLFRKAKWDSEKMSDTKTKR
jgi:transcriptional regulator with XRE-family HTH domain